MPNLIFTYNGDFCDIQSPLPQPLEASIIRLLTYTDRAVEYKNNHSRSANKNPYVTLYDKTKRRFLTGLLPKVLDCIQEYNRANPKTKYKWILRTELPTAPGISKVDIPSWIWQHQVHMCNVFLEHRRCIIKAPTGCGKTIGFCFCISHFPQARIVITVPTIDLLKQTVKEVQEFFPEEPIGTVFSKKKKFERITVGLITSLLKFPDDLLITDIWITDECHNAGDNRYLELSKLLKNTHYRLGVSATPYREKGDSLVMEGLYGPITEITDINTLAKKGQLIKPSYIAISLPAVTRYYKSFDKHLGEYTTINGKPLREEVYQQAIVENAERNSAIISILQTYTETKVAKTRRYPALVLVELIAHGELLSALAHESGIELPFISGQNDTETRNKYKEALAKADGSLLTLCGSRIYNEGTDIPSLKLVIIAGGGGSPRRLTQQIGRVTRRSSGKTAAIVVDFTDPEPFYLSSNYNVRRDTAIELCGRKSVREGSLETVKNMIRQDCAT